MKSVGIFHRLTDAAVAGMDVADDLVKKVNDERRIAGLDPVSGDPVKIDNIARAHAIYTVGIAADVLRTWDAHDVIASMRDLALACPDQNSPVAKDIGRMRSIVKSILDQVGRAHMSRLKESDLA